MPVYSVTVIISGLILAGLSISVSKGRTDLIHDYHQSRVTDKAAYGKAFGKALAVMAGAMLLSGIIGLVDRYSVLAVWVLIAGLLTGVGCIVAVQRKFNKGVF